VRQLRAGLASLGADDLRTVIVAYEPVWAIGTGRTATPQDASSAHAAIRAELRLIAGEGADEIPILYGGSVNPGNAAALLAAPGVDGLLVGGASLEPEGWASICGA
jgi:triosephosphate isomerase